MCVFLLYVLIVLKLCIFFLFLHCVLVYIFTCYCHAMFASFFIVYSLYDSYNNNDNNNNGWQAVMGICPSGRHSDFCYLLVCYCAHCIHSLSCLSLISVSSEDAVYQTWSINKKRSDMWHQVFRLAETLVVVVLRVSSAVL